MYINQRRVYKYGTDIIINQAHIYQSKSDQAHIASYINQVDTISEGDIQT